ncbi:MAG: trimethylamine methyltransferase family protein, partial [Paracoccaceae bacterium]|nr:trimethylamine methyltransferase family protein [Paracoccaceae bacterium]
MTDQKPRRSGRKERLVKRAAKPEIDPCPPGQIGGQYKPLREAEIEKIFDTALRLLEELGMSEVPDGLRIDLKKIGALDNGDGRIRFPRSLTKEAILKACKTFTLHGRDPARSIEVGGDKVYFGTGGAAVQTLDIDSRNY